MRPRVILTVCAAAALVVAAYTVLAPHGLPALLKLRDEERTLTKDVDEARAHNAALAAEVGVLQGKEPESAAVLEKKAREELGWVRTDEVVITVPATEIATAQKAAHVAPEGDVVR